MPTIEEAFYAYIRQQEPIVAMIGDRLYPNMAPQSATFPYATYARASVDTHYMNLGPTGTFTTAFLLECWSLEKSPKQAKQLATRFRAALDGYAGDWDGLEIDGVFLLDEVDKVEYAHDGSDAMIQVVALMFDCWHARDTMLFLP